jgi:cytohesin
MKGEITMKKLLLIVLCLAISGGISCRGDKRYNKNSTEALVVAVRNKNVEAIAKLIFDKADPNAVDEEGTPLLMVNLLQMQVDFAELTSGRTLSGDKSEKATLFINKLLLDIGANPNANDKRGNPVLTAALARNNPDIVAELIKAGASVKVTNSSGSPLIVEAAFSGNQKIVELLLDAGADVNEKDKDGITPLLATTSNQNWELSEVLIQKGADVNAHLANRTTPLFFAAAAGDLKTVTLLVDKGASINVKDNENNSPLSVALRKNHQQVVDYLKTAGAKL